MIRLSLLIAAALVANAALADPAADCRAVGGAFRTGVVQAEPIFRPGRRLKGVELSHTHLTVLTDQDHKLWDVAVDNVYAAGFDQAGEGVPAPLTGIHRGMRVELCGSLYAEGGGIHWVHGNCGATPTPSAPDGWLRLIAADGGRGPNLESSRKYCRLWGR